MGKVLPFPVFLLGLALVMLAGAEDVPPTFREKGLSPQKYLALKNRGLVSDPAKKPTEHCGNDDDMTFSEKAVLADAVVRAKITDIQYLYKEGGPFRTLYTLEVKEVLRGSAAVGKVEVLDRAGPNTRDHTRWRRGDFGIDLEKGDQGYFLLNQSTLQGLARNFPERSAFLENRFMFHGGLRGVYLEKDGELDRKFLVASRKGQQNLKGSEIKAQLAAINSVLKDGGAQ